MDSPEKTAAINWCVASGAPLWDIMQCYHIRRTRVLSLRKYLAMEGTMKKKHVKRYKRKMRLNPDTHWNVAAEATSFVQLVLTGHMTESQVESTILMTESQYHELFDHLSHSAVLINGVRARRAQTFEKFKELMKKR